MTYYSQNYAGILGSPLDLSISINTSYCDGIIFDAFCYLQVLYRNNWWQWWVGPKSSTTEIMRNTV